MTATAGNPSPSARDDSPFIPSPLTGETKLLNPSPLTGEGRVRVARRLRQTMTDAERRLWQMLRDRRLLHAKFRRQQPIGSYIVDFVSFEHRLVIELDGSQHAECMRDRVRDRWLSAQGFRVLRFWNNDVLLRSAGVLRVILHELNTPHPTSPTRGEEKQNRPIIPTRGKTLQRPSHRETERVPSSTPSPLTGEGRVRVARKPIMR